jgi:hypothetical protein
MDLLLWQEGEVRVEILKGDLTVTYGGRGAKGSVAVDMGYLLDKLAEAIPGQLDDLVLKMIKQAIGK